MSSFYYSLSASDNTTFAEPLPIKPSVNIGEGSSSQAGSITSSKSTSPVAKNTVGAPVFKQGEPFDPSSMDIAVFMNETGSVQYFNPITFMQSHPNPSIYHPTELADEDILGNPCQSLPSSLFTAPASSEQAQSSGCCNGPSSLPALPATIPQQKRRKSESNTKKTEKAPKKRRSSMVTMNGGENGNGPWPRGIEPTWRCKWCIMPKRMTPYIRRGPQGEKVVFLFPCFFFLLSSMTNANSHYSYHNLDPLQCLRYLLFSSRSTTSRTLLRICQHQRGRSWCT